VLRERNFRRFYTGYVTSLSGTSMSAVAMAFAVLDSGAGATGLGYVFAAGIGPQVVFMLGGGIAADRLGRRQVMMAADAVCCGSEATLAAVVILGHPRIWVFALLAGVHGTGEAFFTPALGALTVQIAPRDEIGDANALLGLAQSGARVAGPALAGVLVSVIGPGAVIGVDAATFAVSVFALSTLRLPALPRAPARSLVREMAEGWAEFRSRTWLWAGTVQFALLNLLVWGPYLLLGPVLAQHTWAARGPGGPSWPRSAAARCSAECSPSAAGRAGRSWSPPWRVSATRCPACCSRCTRRSSAWPPGRWPPGPDRRSA
jgi:MFS family permease